MFKSFIFILAAWLSPYVVNAETEVVDNRIAVELPDNVKAHFLKKMREHLEALDSIIAAMAEDDLALASDIASKQLGGHWGGRKQGHDHKGAKQKHDGGAEETHQHHKHQGQQLSEGSSHGHGKGLRLGQHMPEAMKFMGKNMHNNAIEFSITAAEGDMTQSLRALRKITTSCVECHRAFRVKTGD